MIRWSGQRVSHSCGIGIATDIVGVRVCASRCCLDIPDLGPPPPNWTVTGNLTFTGEARCNDDVLCWEVRTRFRTVVTYSRVGSHHRLRCASLFAQWQSGGHRYMSFVDTGRPAVFTFPKLPQMNW